MALIAHTATDFSDGAEFVMHHMQAYIAKFFPCEIGRVAYIKIFIRMIWADTHCCQGTLVQLAHERAFPWVPNAWPHGFNIGNRKQ